MTWQWLLPKGWVPWRHQEAAFERFQDRHQVALLWEMGTGKTETAINWAAYQLSQERCDAVLLSCVENGLRHARAWDRVASSDEEVAELAGDLVLALGGKPAELRRGNRLGNALTFHVKHSQKSFALHCVRCGGARSSGE